MNLHGYLKDVKRIKGNCKKVEEINGNRQFKGN